MNIESQALFPVPFFRSVYPSAEELKEQVVPLFLDIEKNDKNPVRYSFNGYTNYENNSQIIDHTELSDLKKFLGTSVQSIHTSLGLPGNVHFTGSWFAINRQYSYHEKHNHLPDIWSGVYYVQANDADAGLTFCNPNHTSNWPFARIETYNEYTTPEITCKASTGVLYVFPSYLEHKVNQQLNDSERIMIAFNMGI